MNAKQDQSKACGQASPIHPKHTQFLSSKLNLLVYSRVLQFSSNLSSEMKSITRWRNLARTSNHLEWICLRQSRARIYRTFIVALRIPYVVTLCLLCFTSP